MAETKEKEKTVLAYMMRNGSVHGRLVLANTVVEIPLDIANDYLKRGVVRKATTEERKAFKAAVDAPHFGEEDAPEAAQADLEKAKSASKSERDVNASAAANQERAASTGS